VAEATEQAGGRGQGAVSAGRPGKARAQAETGPDALKRGLFGIALVHLVSRVLYVALGVRFDIATIETHWQFLDSLLLEKDLWNSVWHLHGQPPLLNLLFGLAAQLSPGDHGMAILTGLFYGFGLVVSLVLYALMVRVGARRYAFLLTTLFIVSPATILFENYFFYTYLVMGLLSIAALCLERYLATDHARWMAGFFWILGVIVLMRSAYHLAWFVLIVSLTLRLRRAQGRRLLALAALPLLLSTGWYAKNLHDFGHFTGSTWMGLNLARFVGSGMTPLEIEALVQDGTVSPLFLRPPFGPLDADRGALPLPPATGQPVLDRTQKSSGANNFNHLIYVTLSERYQADAIRLILRDPTMLLKNQIHSWSTWFRPTSQYFYYLRDAFAGSHLHVNNIERLAPLERTFRLDLAPPVTPEALGPASTLTGGETEGDPSVSWIAVFGTVIVILLTPVIIRRSWHTGGEASLRGTVLLFAWGNLVYVGLLCNVLEAGENNRFRYETMGLWMVLLAASLAWIDPLGRLERRFPGAAGDQGIPGA